MIDYKVILLVNNHSANAKIIKDLKNIKSFFLQLNTTSKI